MRIEVNSASPSSDSRHAWTQRGGAPDQLITIPYRFTAIVDDDRDVDWDVTFIVQGNEESGDHQVEEVTIRRRPGGPPASAAGVRRIPLGRYLVEALGMAMTTWIVTENAHGEPGLSSIEPDPAKPTERQRERAARVATTKRNADSYQRADEALFLYQRAKALGTPNPFQHVGDQLGVGRSMAHRYVQQAKRDRA